MTGKHKHTLRQNAHEEKQAQILAQSELENLRFEQLEERQNLQVSIDNLSQQYTKEHQGLFQNMQAQAEKPEAQGIHTLLQSQGYKVEL